MRSMNALVICGGKGTRVSSITNDEIPKIMIPINGKPFIDYLVESLILHGVGAICFLAGFKADLLRDYVESVLAKKPMYRGWIQFSVIDEDEPLGTGGSVLQACNLAACSLAFGNRWLAVINGDTCVLPAEQSRLEEIVEGFGNRDQNVLSYNKAENEAVIIGGTWMYNDGRYGRLKDSGEDGRIVEFQEKYEGYCQINTGWYIIHKDLIFDLDKVIGARRKLDFYLKDEYKDMMGKFVTMEKDIFPHWLNKGIDMYTWFIEEENWLEIGTPDAIRRAEILLS